MKRVALLILDGWGIAQDKSVSAVDLANTPNMDKLLQEYPNATLSTSGLLLWCSRMCLTIASPKPVPPFSRLRLLSTR